MMSATSCQSVEKKAEKFKARMEKAVTDGDLTEAAKIAEEMEKWVESLSEEDREIVEKVITE